MKRVGKEKKLVRYNDKKKKKKQVIITFLQDINEQPNDDTHSWLDRTQWQASFQKADEGSSDIILQILQNEVTVDQKYKSLKKGSE